MLQTLLAYARGAGVDARWLVIEGDPRFFEITKRLHNHLYGTAGDGGPLGAAERRDYEDDAATKRRGIASTSSVPATSSCCTIRRPAGLAAAVQRDRRTRRVALPRRHRLAERILRPRAGRSCGRTSTRSTDTCSPASRFAPTWVPRQDLAVIAPSIDPFSAKNESIDSAEAVPRYSGTSGSWRRRRTRPIGEFTRRDGSPGRVTARVDLLGTGPRRRLTFRSCCRRRGGTR